MNIGIIGLGSIGLRHAKNSRLLKYKVFGYDIDKEKSRSISAMGGIFIKDKKEFIKKIDVGIISSPNKCHLEDMKFLINNKKHCFIEKPISHEYYQTKKIIDKANSLKLKIFVGHNLRFHPAVKKAKGWLENKKIGRILWSSLICSSYLPDWRKGQDYKQGYANESKGGGVIFDCIHEIDLANHLLGKAQIIKCSAESTKYLKLKTEDIETKYRKNFDKVFKVKINTIKESIGDQEVFNSAISEIKGIDESIFFIISSLTFNSLSENIDVIFSIKILKSIY